MHDVSAHDVIATLPRELSSVPEARHFVEQILLSWGFAELAWPAAVCVSELAANAALHARTDYTVRVTMAGDQVRIEVADRSPRVPRMRDYGEDATTGRGLRMLDGFALRWGVDAHGPEGKTVWLLLDPHGPAAARGDVERGEVDVAALLAAFDEDGDVPESVVSRAPGTQGMRRLAQGAEPLRRAA